MLMSMLHGLIGRHGRIQQGMSYIVRAGDHVLKQVKNQKLLKEAQCFHSCLSMKMQS